MRKSYIIASLSALLVWYLLCPAPSVSRPANDQGQASRTPWSGWWWPLLDSRNPNLYDDDGPLEKYDTYVQRLGWGNPHTQAWEYTNHRTTDLDTGWFGHCHAWAAAAVLESEPLAAGYDAGIYFTVADLKGLVVEAYYSPEAEDYGERYNGRSGDDRQDIYPGLFHTVIRHYIGQQRVPVVADIDAGEEVWNYPAYAYDFLHVKLLDAAGNELTILQTLDDGATPDQWLSSQFDLGSFAGRRVQLAFLATGDEDNITSFFIDDVQLEVCGQGSFTPRAWVYLPWS